MQLQLFLLFLCLRAFSAEKKKELLKPVIGSINTFKSDIDFFEVHEGDLKDMIEHRNELKRKKVEKEKSLRTNILDSLRSIYA